MLALSADPSTITYARLEKYANILTMILVMQLPELCCFRDWNTVILFQTALPKKISSAFKNSKIIQPVSLISSQNVLIRLHFLMTSICSRYIKGLCKRLLLSCTKLFRIFRHIIYLCLSARVYAHNIIWTFHAHFKKLEIGLFPLLDHVYGTRVRARVV